MSFQQNRKPQAKSETGRIRRRGEYFPKRNWKNMEPHRIVNPKFCRKPETESEIEQERIGKYKIEIIALSNRSILFKNWTHP